VKCNFNAVCPSVIDTSMVRNRLQPQSVFDEYMAGQAEMYPLRKIGDVDDVAYA
jgi:NAD(P)-dependent dehydrogenase (short-subunit alcohol dehydrogenase family)